MFSYCSVSSPLDGSKGFTLHPLADLFIPTPTRLLWEAFSHAALMRKDFPLTFPPLSIDRYTFIQLSEQGHRGEDENTKALTQQQTGFEPKVFRLRVQRSTTVLLHSTYYTNSTFIKCAVSRIQFNTFYSFIVCKLQ